MTATAAKGLPGELMMWVLIFSELAVFGAGLAIFLVLRLFDPGGFAEAQTALLPALAGTNTVVLITSGYLAARATRDTAKARAFLIPAALLGVLFLVLKGIEFRHKADLGITFETHDFFMFYYLLTGFHAAHVVAGIIILVLVAWTRVPAHIQTGAAFWHMVDLVWILLFPVVYLL
ncbi:cytochrome c oxidase subunit 3 [Ovoidimarina sediminis]|uniref:cytochrome c oxidase subunit 3 n=1 Tax=Ovoidimarina sediminis TaxID=3079856 RepID=UPI00290DB31A|nr:cytochrome c oxidase subunit 3 [Rhodophyticola sp. MJ-SS7]MDU8941851.1 cytochrome c oxidase subunit 3 [Rhodophyticola sp. MJ-SS7]